MITNNYFQKFLMKVYKSLRDCIVKGDQLRFETRIQNDSHMELICTEKICIPQ